MITVTREERCYQPRRVTTRFVKFNGGDAGFTWIERGKIGQRDYDMREGTCDEDDLPPAVAVAAREKREEGIYPFYVEWARDPLSILHR